MNDETKKNNPDLQGEGNYDATHNYQKGLEASVKKGDAEKLAKDAEKALDGAEGAELKEAEERGKNAQVKQ